MVFTKFSWWQKYTMRQECWVLIHVSISAFTAFSDLETIWSGPLTCIYNSFFYLKHMTTEQRINFWWLISIKYNAAPLDFLFIPMFLEYYFLSQIFFLQKIKEEKKNLSLEWAHPTIWNCQTRWFRNVTDVHRKQLLETKNCCNLTTGCYSKINTISQAVVFAFLTHDGNLCSGGVGGLLPASRTPASKLTASLCPADKWLISSHTPASFFTRPCSVSIFSSTPSSSMSVSFTCPWQTGESVTGWKVLASKLITWWKESAPGCGWL